MEIFIDTAEIDQVRRYSKVGIIDGVTTNPSLIAQAKSACHGEATRTMTHGRDLFHELKHTILELCSLVDGPVSTEVVHEDTAGMLSDAYEYVSWHKNIVVKLPMTENGLIALRELKKKKIKTNVTLVFSLSQALLAAKCGATYISPFVGRLDDIDVDGMALIRDMVQMKRLHGFESKILVASIRSISHIEQAALLGADVCTVPPKLIDEMIAHPLTEKGHKVFLEDWNNNVL